MTSRLHGHDVRVCVRVGSPTCLNCPPLSLEEGARRRQVFRVWLDADDANSIVRMEELRDTTTETVALACVPPSHYTFNGRSAPRETRDLIPSHQVLQDFLDSRPEEKKFKSVAGKERRRLKSKVFPHLTNIQKVRFTNDQREFDAWLTDALRGRRIFVTQLEKTDINLHGSAAYS